MWLQHKMSNGWREQVSHWHQDPCSYADVFNRGSEGGGSGASLSSVLTEAFVDFLSFSKKNAERVP
jgi:hypothetical protein